MSTIPEREAFPMIINPDLWKFDDLPERERGEFRKKEVATLASQINSLPFIDFAEDREREIGRLLPYYTEFTNLFGVDLIAVARTRMQSSGIVMKSSPLFMLSMIDDDQKSEKNAIFFESRLEAGGFKLNATSQNIIEGFSYRFSVLKRQLKDRYGDYEVDFPAVSLDRKPLARLMEWHKEVFKELPFEENAILKNMEDLFALRVHDWFHSAVIYDTSSMTSIFKKWSDNSFFVKHFFDNPFMINYELLADKTHYLVWQEMFKKGPQLRRKIIDKAEMLLEGIHELERWGNSKNKISAENSRISNYLAYVGLRGLFNVIPFEDSELIAAVGRDNLFKKVTNEALSPYKEYLKRVYEGIEDIPFRASSDQSLSMEKIFEEYVDALTEESRLQIAKATTTTILRIDLSGVGMKRLLESFPKEILRKMSELDLDLADYDPRIFQIISACFGYIKNKCGEDTFDEYTKRVEVDSFGYFYLKVERDEIDKSIGWEEATHSKDSVLIQLPWNYPNELTLLVKRTENLLADQVGATVKICQGEIILINVQNRELAERLILEGRQMSGEFDFNLFWKALERERARGHQGLGDIYPYDKDKLLRVFNIPSQKTRVVDGRFILDPDVYSTYESKRKVTRALGPVSMDGNTKADRRRILFGAIVDNHVSSETKIDRFPVDARSFDKFYKQTSRLDLPPFRFDENKVTLKGMNEVLDTLLKSLEQANSIRIYGFRGKPEKVKVALVLE